MVNSEEGWVTTTTHHKSIRWLLDTPTKRRLVFTGIVALLAVLAYVAFRISFELYAPMSCVTKSCAASLHHTWYWSSIAGDAFRVTVMSGTIGLVLGCARNLRVVDDIFEQFARKDRTKLRKRLGTSLMWTRRISSLITITSFVTSFVALMILAKIT